MKRSVIGRLKTKIIIIIHLKIGKTLKIVVIFYIDHNNEPLMVRIITIFSVPNPILKIFFILILSSSINIATASQAQVSIDPVSQTVEKGQEFSINITIDPVSNPVAGIQFNLIFDSTLVSIKNVTQGDIFRKNRITTFFNPGTIDNSKGTLNNVWEVITTPGMNITARGTFARINMYAKNAGTVYPGLIKVVLSDPDGKSIPFILKNGTIIISSPAVNLIRNPGFESGTSPWLFYTNGKGTFSITSPGFQGSAARLTLNSSGTNIQLYQTGITLEQNKRYRLRFSAYSTTGHDLNVRLIKHGSPYTFYGLNYKVYLSTGWQTYITEFTTSGFTGTVKDGRLYFWLAPFAAAGDVYFIDEVRLEAIP